MALPTKASGDTYLESGDYTPYAEALNRRHRVIGLTQMPTLTEKKAFSRSGTAQSTPTGDFPQAFPEWQSVSPVGWRNSGYPGGPTTGYGPFGIELGWVNLLAQAANLRLFYIKMGNDYNAWTPQDFESLGSAVRTAIGISIYLCTPDLENAKLIWALGPKQWTWTYPREIASLSDSGVDGQKAMFFDNSDGFEFGATVTPAGERIHSGKVFARVAGAWVEDWSGQKPDRITISSINPKRGYMMTPGLINELKAMLEEEKWSLHGADPINDGIPNGKGATSGYSKADAESLFNAATPALVDWSENNYAYMASSAMDLDPVPTPPPPNPPLGQYTLSNNVYKYEVDISGEFSRTLTFHAFAGDRGPAFMHEIDDHNSGLLFGGTPNPNCSDPNFANFLPTLKAFHISGINSTVNYKSPFLGDVDEVPSWPTGSITGVTKNRGWGMSQFDGPTSNVWVIAKWDVAGGFVD